MEHEKKSITEHLLRFDVKGERAGSMFYNIFVCVCVSIVHNTYVCMYFYNVVQYIVEYSVL